MKKGKSQLPFLIKFDSFLRKTEIFKKVEGTYPRLKYRLLETPFYLIIGVRACSEDDISWELNINSKDARKLLRSRNIPIKRPPKPVTRVKSNFAAAVTSKDWKPHFKHISKVELSQYLMDLFPELPDYVQEGIICNIGLFSPD